MKKGISILLTLLLCMLPLSGALAAPKDATPHAAVELRLIGGEHMLPPSAFEAGFSAGELDALGVETVIPVRESLLAERVRSEAEGAVLAGDLIPEPDVPDPFGESLVGLPTRWILIPSDPTHEAAAALAAALHEKYVRDAVDPDHPLGAALMNARVIDYEGTDILAYGNYLIKVWLRMPYGEPIRSDLFEQPDIATWRQCARLPGLRVCVLWPKEASDFQAAYRTLLSLYRAGLIFDGGVFPTFEVAGLLETASYADVARPLPGDPDGDGRLTSADARMALRMSVDLFDRDVAPDFCDMDGDGVVTAADARAILRAAVGLEIPIPRYRLPVRSSGTVVIGPIEGHMDGGYTLTASSSDPALSVRLLAADAGLPGYVGGADYHYLVVSANAPGTYRVTLTEQRSWEADPLSVREIEIVAA